MGLRKDTPMDVLNMKDFRANAWFLPQPVVVLGTYDADGTANAMNVAWAGQHTPTQVILSLGTHQTTDNLHRVGEFTIAFATRETMVAADFVGMTSGRKVHDKVARTGWKVEEAPNVAAPLFADFPMTMECRAVEPLGDDRHEHFIVADIVNIVCREEYLTEEGVPDVEKMGLITYDPCQHTYIALGARVGQAFSIGKELGEK